MKENEATLQKKDNRKIKKIFSWIFSVFYAFILVVLVVFLAYGIGIRVQNRLPTFFGKSYVKITSGSMVASGFNVGDVAMISQTKVSKLEVDNIIAFYDYSGEQPNEPSLRESNEDAIDLKTGQSSFSTNIIFHKIVEIKMDANGNLWFKTRGTSNGSDDDYTPADHVIGAYHESGVATLLELLSSKVTMICCIILPSGIIMISLLIQIIQLIDEMKKPKDETINAKQHKLKEITDDDKNAGDDFNNE